MQLVDEGTIDRDTSTFRLRRARRFARLARMKRIYLDHNATSPLRAEVAERLRALLDEGCGNPGSIHREGQRARGVLERARSEILRSIGGESGALTFTSGATEANNIALLSLRAGDVLVTSRLEHPSLRDVAEVLEERGVEIRWMRHDADGRFDLESLASLLPGASLLAITAANNELGNLNPVAEIGALCASAGVRFHVDAAQLWGRLPFRVFEGVSSVTLSSHKAGGPVGIGALWVAEPRLYPAQSFGGQQERGRRAGTENVLFAAAMAEIARRVQSDEGFVRAWCGCEPLRDRLAHGLEALGGVRNGDRLRALPNTLNMSFPGFEAEELVMALDLEGVAISAGSACTAGSMDVSPVIEALGVGDERTRAALRFSLGPLTTAAEIDEVIARVQTVLARPR